MLVCADNFANAKEDFEKALAIRQRVLPENSRLIAETLFDLGSCQRSAEDDDAAAVPFFRRAVEVLQNNVATLEAIAEADRTGEQQRDLEELRAVTAQLSEQVVLIFRSLFWWRIHACVYCVRGGFFRDCDCDDDGDGGGNL